MSAHDDEVARVRDLISEEPAAEEDKSSVAGWLQRVCRAAMRDLPAMGVGISILAAEANPIPVAASGATSVLVEELQFVLGEGPCIDAFASRSPVLVPDLSAASATTWPGYAPAAHDHGVRAVFAFPLQVGVARLGAMDVYRDHIGNLSPQTLRRALAFANVAMNAILHAGQGIEGAAELLDDLDDSRLEVYQAQGMLMSQLDVSAEEALMRLRAYAYSHERHASDVARDVIARKLTLESDA